jgi:4-amino-4-deoxy-L-arabinose transferase-like glycosyltransferase
LLIETLAQQSKINNLNSTMSSRSRPLTDWLALAGFCAFLFFFRLSSFGLIGPDEPRYAQVAREMLARHDWITPTLDGSPWLEKPVLYYWQAMLAYKLFDVSDWASRLPSALDASLMIIAVYLFLRRFRPGFQLDEALIVASTAGIIGFARAASTDMALAATFTISLIAWYAYFESGSKLYLATSYCFLALATLAKGPVAPLLAVMVISIFAGCKRDYRLLARSLWIPGILLFCILTLPWYVAVQVHNPEFFRSFILEQNFARYGTNLYRHEQPFWYYLPVILLGLVPWTMFAASAMLENIRKFWAQRAEFSESGEALNIFLVIWILVPIAFFSISRSKLPGYILPALPAGGLLLAEYLKIRVTADVRPKLPLILSHAVLAALIIVPALLLPYLVFQHRLPWGRTMAIPVAFAITLAGGIVLTLRNRAGLRMLRFVTLIPVLLSMAAVLKIGAPVLDSTLSARPLANEIARMENMPLPLAVFRVSRETQYGLQFYRNQTVSRYDLGEIPTGEHLLVAPEGMQTAIAKNVAGRRVSYLGSFAAQGLDYYWVASAK